jgi:hypothetical protein
MDEPVVVRLPPLAGGQAESWRALIEIAPKLGRPWLLIGGQMVFLHEVERESTDVRPTNDIDLVDHQGTLDARTDRRASRPQPLGCAIDSTGYRGTARLSCVPYPCHNGSEMGITGQYW